MGLEDVEYDAEENLEVVWDIMTALATITYKINALCMLSVLGIIDFALLHLKVCER